MSAQATWTNERVDELRRLIVTERLNPAQAGRSLGVTRNAVIGKCWRARIALRGGRSHWRPAEPTPNHFPDPSSCLWGLGDPAKPGFRFCGKARALGKPYCAEHAARAYDRRPTADVEAEL